MAVAIQVVGDLHLEFQDRPRLPPAVGDVIVLAGDTGVGVEGLRQVRETWRDRPVVYVAGNHEYYRHALPALTEALRDEAEGGSVFFLENDARVIRGVRFLGCTLWTDFRLHGEGEAQAACIAHAADLLRDFSSIQVAPEFRRLRPDDMAHLHRASTSWLRARLLEPFAGPTVVVTHHAPSLRSIAPSYQDDPLSAAFASNLEGVMEGFGVALWVHGHTHYSVDYAVGPTRVVSNQRGYKDGEDPNYRETLTVEV